MSDEEKSNDVSHKTGQSAIVRAFSSFWSLIREQPVLCTMIAAALVGIGISVYLTITHYAQVAPVCTAVSHIDCGDVTRSAFSTIPPNAGKNGIPITIPGTLWFIVSGALALVALLRARRGEPEPARLRLYHLLWSIGGMLFVLYLVYDEIVQLHLTFCEWCTGVHILTLLTFILAWYRFANPNAGREQPEPALAYRDLQPARKHTSNTAHGVTLPRSMRKAAQGSRTPARTRSRR